MRKPRTTIILLAATLVVIGFSGQALPAGKSIKTTVSMVKIGNVFPRVSPPRFAPCGASKMASSVAANVNLAASDRSPRATATSLSADGNALVAEMCDLQLLAYDTQLSLNSQQWSALAGVVLRTQAIRQTYEAQIATSQMVAPGQYRVEIPTYPNVGDLLRDKFNTDLRMELGEATAADVMARLGDRLEDRFAGFGVSVQTLDIADSLRGTLTDVQVTRTVTYWNSVEGSDRVTTRREIHFPAWEDPTGDRWSALLAIVKA